MKTKLILFVATIVFTIFGAMLWQRAVKVQKAAFGDKWIEASRYNYKNPNDNQSSIKAWALDIQNKIHNWNQSHGIDGEEGELVEAITIGRREGLSKQTKESFTKSGIRHMLAISGFHVGIIYFILQFVFLKHIVGFRYRYISQTLIILTLWIYALITGMSPSTIRAVTMCTLMSISKIHTNTLLSFRILILSAIIMYIADPLIVLNVGFQLSYASMVGIYLIGQKLMSWYEGYCFVDRMIWCTVCITVVCTLSTLPLQSYYFGSFSTVGIIGNLIVTPLTMGLMVGYVGSVAVTLALGWTGMELRWMGEGVRWIAGAIVRVAEHVGAWTNATVEWEINEGELILGYAVFGVFVVVVRAYFRDYDRKRDEKVV